MIGESHTILSQRIDVGCSEQRLRSGASEKFCVMLISIDEEDVGLLDGMAGLYLFSFLRSESSLLLRCKCLRLRHHLQVLERCGV